jgi:lipid A 3-O-deacylase
MLELRLGTGYRAAALSHRSVSRGSMPTSRSISAGALAGIALATVLPGTARADDGIFDEVRLGVYEHDASLLGHQKETGADIGAEVLLASPPPLAVIGGPRPTFGALVNTAGETDQIYGGMTWTWNFVHDVLREGDGFYVEGVLGGGWNDGKISATPAEAQVRKSLGSNVLFREDVDLGYRITPHWAVAVSYNHISNADLATRNEGLNDIGVRVGLKF